jgi:hypothetical protein
MYTNPQGSANLQRRRSDLPIMGAQPGVSALVRATILLLWPFPEHCGGFASG